MCFNRFEHFVRGDYFIIDVSIQIWTLCKGTWFNYRCVYTDLKSAQLDIVQSFRSVHTVWTVLIGQTRMCLYRFGGFQQIDSQFPVCLYRFEHCNKSLIHRCVYTDVNNFSKIICQSFSCVYKYLNTLKQVTIWLQANSRQTNLHLGQVNTKLVKSP